MRTYPISDRANRPTDAACVAKKEESNNEDQEDPNHSPKELLCEHNDAAHVLLLKLSLTTPRPPGSATSKTQLTIPKNLGLFCSTSALPYR